MPTLEHTDEYKLLCWDLSKREQLPRLIPVSDKVSREWLAFEAELRACAAKVMRRPITRPLPMLTVIVAFALDLRRRARGGFWRPAFLDVRRQQEHQQKTGSLQADMPALCRFRCKSRRTSATKSANSGYRWGQGHTRNGSVEPLRRLCR